MPPTDDAQGRRQGWVGRGGGGGTLNFN